MLIRTPVNEKLTVLQRKDGLLFGTDSLLLASFIRPLPSEDAVEFGAGCGFVSLACASKGFFRFVTAVELQEAYVAPLSENILSNGLTDKMSFLHKDVRTLREDDLSSRPSVVFFNPPYHSVSSGRRPSGTLADRSRFEINGSLADFAASASNLLQTGGLLFFVYPADRLSFLFSCLSAVSFEPKRMTFVYPAPDSRPCLVLVEAKKKAKASLFLTPPLFLRDADGKNTPEMSYILRYGVFPDEYTLRSRKKQN